MRNLETILITGGAGFIGSNLCEHFLNQGKKVVCLDNFLTGKKKNIAHLLDNPAFELVEGDIRNFETCLEVTQRVDAVLHQAALGSVPRSIENPITTNEINCHGFLNMLTAAKTNGVKRFVYASSSSVYGDSQLSPKVESQLGKPLSPYAVSKLTNELYGKVFHDLYGMETIGLRYFNVFGKNQDPEGAYAAAIPKFIESIRNNKSPLVYGDGKQTRDFTYVKNVVAVNDLALNSENPSCFGNAYNIACGQSYSIVEVITTIKNALVECGYDVNSVEAEFANTRKGDILNSLADISAAKNHLGYTPLYSCQEGMTEYISNLTTVNG